MILILSTGRSGSTAVAKILHQELGVNFGARFSDNGEYIPKPAKELKDDCNYEDGDFQEVDMKFMVMGLSTHNFEYPWSEWRKEFKRVVATKKEPYGIKEPNMSICVDLLNEYLSLNPRIIFCTRNKEDTIESFKKTYKHKDHLAMEMVENRLENLKEALKEKTILR